MPKMQPAFIHTFGVVSLRRSMFTRPMISIAPSTVRFRASMVTGSQNPLGFLGLGIMGLPMAANLVKDNPDRKLVVWNRSSHRCDELQRLVPHERVEIASTPKEVVENCDTTFVMLSTPQAVKEVFEGKGGALEGCSDGKAIVDCSTLTVEDAEKNSKMIQSSGGLFLEAPVSGSKGPAEQGKLLFLCAGSEKVYRSILDCLGAMGKRNFYFGQRVGAGTQMKLVVNMIMGSMLASLAEGITLAEKCGLTADELVDVLSQGAMANPMFSLKGPKMGLERKDFQVNFPLEHCQKDLRFALLLADEFGIPLPVCAAANETYKAAKGLGLSRSDFAAVIESLRISANRHT